MTKLPADFELDRYGLHCRLVNEGDAEFIVSLRSDARLGRFIHASDGDVQKQIEWTREYKKREAEGLDYYFVFETVQGHSLGVYRIYNVTDVSFTTGSWLFYKDAPMGASLLALIIAREVAFDLHPDLVNLFEVMKANKSVVDFNLSFNPTLVQETDENLFFQTTKNVFEANKMKYINMLAKRMPRLCEAYDEQFAGK